MKKKYAVGLVVGRFQPFHNGHLYLLRQALEQAEQLVIGIGSSNVSNHDNPYFLTKRKKAIQEVIKRENLGKRIKSIISLPDIPDDDEWARRTLSKSGKVDVIISNNDSGVNVFFEKLGIPILRFSYYDREHLEGVKIRKLMRGGEKWEDRIPQYLLPFFKK